jgi:hypothetical protein
MNVVDYAAHHIPHTTHHNRITSVQYRISKYDIIYLIFLFLHRRRWPCFKLIQNNNTTLASILVSTVLEIIQLSSGSTVSGYGLDDRVFEVQSPTEAKRIFSSSVCGQNGSEAHPASCRISSRGPFPEGKAGPGRNADHSHTSSADVFNE